MLKKIIIFPFIFLIIFFSGWLARGLFLGSKSENQLLPAIPKLKPFEKYSIENLSKAGVKAGKLTVTEIIKEDKDYISYLFEFNFNPNLDGKTYKKITGQINVPTTEGKFPLILMFRGYIDQKTYKTGDGTRNASAFFAKNGFITIAPDFLGYGDSDSESSNIFESRFQTYTTALSLLKTLETLHSDGSLVSGLDKAFEPLKNYTSLFLWGHSNGGQVALTVLEESGVSYPAVLWAPVSKPFPYSVLYYTDDSEDHGKLIRKELSKFEDDYDVELYSLSNYLDRINAPIQLDQGTVDTAVPKQWSDTLSRTLKKLDKKVTYNVYTGLDHNMRPGWDEVISKDLLFYKSFSSK